MDLDAVEHGLREILGGRYGRKPAELDVAVGAVPDTVDGWHRLLGDPRRPETPVDELAEACATWQGGRDFGSSLLRAAARVLVDRPHYFRAAFITDLERTARSNPTALGQAATLLRAVNASRPLTADQWSTEVGLPTTGFAGRGLAPKLAEDDQIRTALKEGRITMPLWGVSLDVDVARSYGGDEAPRWIFEIVGEFRAVPAWTHSGVKDDERELICGGQYDVLSMADEGPTTRVRLEYVGRVGDKVGSNTTLLELMGRVPGVVSSRLQRIGSARAELSGEKLSLRLVGDRAFEATVNDAEPTRVVTSYRPKGWFDGENVYCFDWEFDDGDGFTTVTLPADVDAITAYIARRSKPAWLDVRRDLIERFLRCSSASGEPWESNGSFDLPGAGYVQWTRVEDRGTPVHVEINEGTFAEPMPEELVDRLTMIGWNAPDEIFRNCWTRVEPHQGYEPFAAVADLVLLATTIVSAGLPTD